MGVGFAGGLNRVREESTINYFILDGHNSSWGRAIYLLHLDLHQASGILYVTGL
jgi:hypothetical protein